MNRSIPGALRVLLIALMTAMTACARTSTSLLDTDRIEIAVRVGTICDAANADRIARRQAAVETIRRGFDEYQVIGSVGGDHVAYDRPLTARTMLSGDRTGTFLSEDAPLLARHRVLTIRMFHAGQDGSEEAVSARAVLGSDWETLATKGAPTTCFGADG